MYFIVQISGRQIVVALTQVVLTNLSNNEVVFKERGSYPSGIFLHHHFSEFLSEGKICFYAGNVGRPHAMSKQLYINHQNRSTINIRHPNIQL